MDEREADSGVTYRYRVSADVTDEGGETRSAERVFNIGFVAVRASLDPAHLQIVDESHRHAGHAGARSGASHYRVTIVSDRFEGRSRIERHRMLYDALGPMMGPEVHALVIRARTPEEWCEEEQA